MPAERDGGGQRQRKKSGGDQPKESTDRVGRDAGGRETVLDLAVLVTLLPCTEPAPAYEVVKELRGDEDEELFPESSVYRRLKVLAKKGYLYSVEVDGRTGRRAGYLPTQQGRDEVARWLGTSAENPFAVSRDARLRVAAMRSFSPEEVMPCLEAALADLEYFKANIEFGAQTARRYGGWDLATELEYQLEMTLFQASEKWLTHAVEMLRGESRHAKARLD